MPPKSSSGNHDLLAKMKDIEARALERSHSRREQVASVPENPPPTNVIKLPLWPDAVRAVPNGFLRSALFGAIRRGARRYMQRERIAALDGIEIFYTGQRLDQGDLDVWEMLLHITRLQGLGNECRVKAYQLLKKLEKADTGGNREVLHIRLMRLKATAIEIEQGRYGYAGSLIDEVYRDKETQEYVFRANPKLRALFEPDQFTQIDWAVRRELDGQPLAQWLHGFYASHAQPHPVHMETLLKLAGSEDASPTSARQTLRKAFEAVAKASKAHGEEFSYEIHSDLVHAQKKGSKSQRRHLAKKNGKLPKPRT